MTLLPVDRQEIINYRVERAYQTFEEAEYVAKGKFWNLTANRLYYSVFYMCIALLLSIKISASSHTGISRMMYLHYITTNKLNEEEGNLLRQLFRMRQTGDYDDLNDWTQNDIEPLFPKAKALLSKLHSMIVITSD